MRSERLFAWTALGVAVGGVALGCATGRAAWAGEAGAVIVAMSFGYLFFGDDLTEWLGDEEPLLPPGASVEDRVEALETRVAALVATRKSAAATQSRRRLGLAAISVGGTLLWGFGTPLLDWWL